mmetsp:Transcript_68693/g.190133  ORF Transcript_68693/g.190133 Transcript_68693/m.190133 type:complete len:211 (-) Transcript_68693:84-716(-)
MLDSVPLRLLRLHGIAEQLLLGGQGRKDFEDAELPAQVLLWLHRHLHQGRANVRDDLQNAGQVKVIDVLPQGQEVDPKLRIRRPDGREEVCALPHDSEGLHKVQQLDVGQECLWVVADLWVALFQQYLADGLVRLARAIAEDLDGHFQVVTADAFVPHLVACARDPVVLVLLLVPAVLLLLPGQLAQHLTAVVLRGELQALLQERPHAGQ